MDDQQFDSLARRWGSLATRRGAIRVAAGGALAAALAALGGEEAASRRRQPSCATILCAEGYVYVDRPRRGGRCVCRRPPCGGLAGTPCPDGYVCADDPGDGCDPGRGADCSGVCVRRSG